MNAFPERLKAWRKRTRLKQDEAADKLGVGRTYYSRLENGKKSPGKFLLEKFELLDRDPFSAVPSAHIQESRVFELPGSAGPKKNSQGRGKTPREILRFALERRGLTAGLLAKQMDYDAAIVENVVNGAGKLSRSMAEKIVAVIPDLDIDELLSGSDVARIIDSSGRTGTVGDAPSIQFPGKRKTRNVPKLSWAAAGHLETALATDEGWDGDGVPSNVAGRAFAVEINGDSMYPEISPGDYAVVSVESKARPGQVVLVKTIHGEVLCKRYSIRGKEKLVILSSVNKSYEPYEIPESEIAWIYPVKQVVKNYE
jgi:SOS-response transcriptional repressor LexA